MSNMELAHTLKKIYQNNIKLGKRIKESKRAISKIDLDIQMMEDALRQIRHS